MKLLAGTAWVTRFALRGSPADAYVAPSATHRPLSHSLKPMVSCPQCGRDNPDDARFCTGTTLVLDGGFTAQ